MDNDSVMTVEQARRKYNKARDAYNKHRNKNATQGMGCLDSNCPEYEIHKKLGNDYSRALANLEKAKRQAKFL